MIRLAASLSLTHLLVLARRRTLYLVSGLATVLSLGTFATVLWLADILNHREQPIIIIKPPNPPAYILISRLPPRVHSFIFRIQHFVFFGGGKPDFCRCK